MADYKKLYFKMFRASEQAINLLLTAQQECEEHYISSEESPIRMVPFPLKDAKEMDEE